MTSLTSARSTQPSPDGHAASNRPRTLRTQPPLVLAGARAFSDHLRRAKVQAMFAALSPVSEHLPGIGWAHRWAYGRTAAAG
jgi:hypothetical protein